MKKIGVIDDDREMRDLIADVLRRHGYEVTPFESASSALQQLQSGLAPDAVICDVIMPDMDGREFVKRFKSTQPNVPVILITAFGSALSPREAIVAGASRLLMKPFSISELTDAIRVTVG